MTDKILIDRAVVVQALDALEIYPVAFNHWKTVLLPVATALRAALAQQEQGSTWTVDECARVTKTLRYMQGIAERGEGRAMRDDETLESFVLGYVKRLESALEQQERKPVVWRYKYADGFWRFSNGEQVNGCYPVESQPLYTHPPAIPKQELLPQDDINWLKARPHIEQFIKEQDHDVTVTDRGVAFKSRGMWVDREFFARSAIGIKEEGEVHWAVEWGQKNDRPFCMISKRLDNGLSQIMATHYGPPRREWVNLTHEEIVKIAVECHRISPSEFYFARAIEDALKEKNT